jgi:MFS family permease
VDRRTLLILALYQLLASNRSGIFTVYFVLFLSADKGATLAQGLLFLSAGYVAASLVGPLVGRWSDRIGRRRPFLLFGEASSLPLFLLIPWLPGFVVAGSVFVLAQAFLAFGAPALNAFVADVTRDADRGAGYGILNSVSAAGAIGGFVIAGFVALAWGYSALFDMVGVLMVAAVFVVWTFVPDLPSPRSLGRKPLREMRDLAVFSTTVSIRALGAGAVITFYGAYAALLGATPPEIALVAVAGLGASALASAPLGRSIDRIGEIRGLLYGTLISVGAMVLYLLAARWYDLIPARITYQVGFALMNPAMLGWVAKLAPPARRAEYMGFFALINSTLWSLGPLAGGVAYTLGGATGLFEFAIASTVISLVALRVLYPTAPVGREAPMPGAPEVAT